jgi:tetratricopeptide (TPR) repeat protein
MTQTSSNPPSKPPQAPSAAVPDGKGAAFFKHAEQVAEMGNWDFAIEMYLEGIKREPENIERGYQALRKVSLERKLKGGKPAGMMEAIKRRGKEPIEKLACALFLLAKDPGSVSHMLGVMKAAEEGKLTTVVKWICDIILEAERQAKKPNKSILVQLIAAYESVQEYPKAIQACELALRTYPDDDPLQNKLRDLGATNTRVAGKYGEVGAFSKGVKDMDKQKALAQSEYVQQTVAARELRVEAARKDYLATPKVMGKIHGLVDALCKMEEESFENEAIDVLTKAHSDTQAYQFKARIDDIKMAQMKRRERKLQEAGDKDTAAEQARTRLAFEMQVYQERAKEYPTDLNIKYELGIRQLASNLYDDSIASLQQSQRDPRRHVSSLTLLGRAFAAKKWFREAAETYEKALSVELPEDRAKVLRYHFGDVLEKMADGATVPKDRLAIYEKTLDQFSQVAQMDLRFRDVAQRIEAIRKKIEEARAVV